MLAKIELQVLGIVFSLINCKFLRLPISWENGRVKLEVKFGGRQYNFLICSLLLIHTAYCMKQVQNLIQERKISACIVHFVLVCRYLAHLVFRLNICSFKTDMANVINETLVINSTWGKLTISDFLGIRWFDMYQNLYCDIFWHFRRFKAQNHRKPR